MIVPRKIREVEARRFRAALLCILRDLAERRQRCPESKILAEQIDGATKKRVDNAIRDLVAAKAITVYRIPGTNARAVVFPDGASTMAENLDAAESAAPMVFTAMADFEAKLRAAGGYQDAKVRDCPGRPRFAPHKRIDHTCGGVACYGGI